MQNKSQEERLNYLLHEFKEESGRDKDMEVGEDYREKRMALRSLMNICMPGWMKEDVVKVQDEYPAE